MNSPIAFLVPPSPPAERLVFATREEWLAARMLDVTASDIGALLGISPWKSREALITEKRLGEREPENDAMRRGRILEPAVAKHYQLEHPEAIVEAFGEPTGGGYVYLRDVDHRLGATLDFIVRVDGCRYALECKTASPNSFRKNWGGGVPPEYVTLQALTQAMVAGLDGAVVACMTGSLYRLELHTWTVPRHAGLETRIKDAARRFWMEVEG